MKSLTRYRVSTAGIVAMLYCLVSSGAFGIEEIVPLIGPGMTIVLLAGLPIIWGLPLCLMIAECNSALPAEGGLYAWVKLAFGETWGFQLGWWTCASLFISSGTYISLVSGYAGQLLNFDQGAALPFKVILVSIIAVVNILGIKHVERFDAIFAVVIAATFLAVTVIGVLGWTTNPMEPILAPKASFGDLAEGLLLGIWLYCGFESIATIGEEVSNPLAISHGLVVALPVIAVSYLLPTLATLAYLPAASWESWGIYEGSGSPALGFVTVLNHEFGDIGGILFLVAAVLSQIALYTSYLASGSRTLLVLSRDGLAPRSLSRLGDTKRTPYIGICAIAFASVVLSQFEFTFLIELESVFILASYVMLSFTVVKLRRILPLEMRGETRTCTIAGGKPGLIVCASFPIALTTVALLLNGPLYILYAAVAIASGFAAFAIAKKHRLHQPDNARCDNWTLSEGSGDWMHAARHDIELAAYDNYSSSMPWPEGDAWHDATKNIIDSHVVEWIKRTVQQGDQTLVAGAGTCEYGLDAENTIYLDIVECYVTKYKRGLIGRIEAIPLEDKSVHQVICVGSVINYADAHRAIAEFWRVLKPGGQLLIEYERSNSAEFLFTREYGATVFRKTYRYNGQDHPLWLYGERHIDEIMEVVGFRKDSNYRFQVLSSLLNKLGMPEWKAAPFSKFDRALQAVSYPIAHNVIISATKSLRTE